MTDDGNPREGLSGGDGEERTEERDALDPGRGPPSCNKFMLKCSKINF